MSSGSGLLYGKWPAVVTAYDQDSRTCEIEIPGQTDGSQLRMIAEIEYPIGDKSRHATMTEIEILPGDLVWIEFIQGDPRYPLITGWRNPTQGNSKDWRRWHHKNIEILADNLICELSGLDKRVKAGNDVQVQAGIDVLIKAGDSFKAVASNKAQITGGKVNITATDGSIVLRSKTGVLVI